MIAVIAANWRKNLNFFALGLVALLIVASLVHVFVTPIGGFTGLLRLVLFLTTAALVGAIAKPEIFDGIFRSFVVNNELSSKINELREHRQIDPATLAKFKELALANKRLLTFDGWGDLGLLSPMELAIDKKQAQLVGALLDCGASPFEKIDRKRVTPLDHALKMGDRETAAVIATALAKFPKEKTDHHGISRALIAIAFNDLEMLKACSKQELDQRDMSGRTPIFAAISMQSGKAILDHLIASGVDLNTPIISTNGEKIVAAQYAAVFASNTKDETALIAILQSGRARIAYDDQFGDAVFIAISYGLMKSVKVMEASYDWSTIHDGETALDAAKSSKNLAMLELVTKNMQSRGLINAPAGQAASAPKAAAPAVSVIANRKIELDDLKMNVKMSLEGLVEMDGFADELATAVHEFYSRKPKQSHGIVVWGDASVGKSSVGKRLSGLLVDQGPPGLDIPEIPFEYHSLADSGKSVPEIIENVPAGSIVFFDEIDKFFDPKSNLVSDAEAQRIKTQIITNWDRKPIFWIFAGTFHALRGKGPLTTPLLLNLLGSELNSRVDFGPWKIAPWTQDKIFAAAKHHIEESFGSNFDNDAITLICDKAIQAEGGFREFEKHARALYRYAQKLNSAQPFVSIEVANRYYHELEGLSA